MNRSEEANHENAISSPEKSTISKKKLSQIAGLNSSLRKSSKLVANLSKDRGSKLKRKGPDRLS